MSWLLNIKFDNKGLPYDNKLKFVWVLCSNHTSSEISCQRKQLEAIIKFQNEFKWLLVNQVSNDCTGFKKSGDCVYRLFRNELKLTLIELKTGA